MQRYLMKRKAVKLILSYLVLISIIFNERRSTPDIILTGQVFYQTRVVQGSSNFAARHPSISRCRKTNSSLCSCD